MGSYSPPPVSLEVEKNSWQEIGRVNIPGNAISLVPPNTLAIDESTRRLIFFNEYSVMIVDFVTSSYTVTDITPRHFNYVEQRTTYSIRKKYFLQYTSANLNLTILKNGVEILLPPHGLHVVSSSSTFIEISPSGRYAAILGKFWTEDWSDTYIAAILYG